VPPVLERAAGGLIPIQPARPSARVTSSESPVREHPLPPPLRIGLELRHELARERVRLLAEGDLLAREAQVHERRC